MIDPVLRAFLQPLVRRHRRREFSLRMAWAWGVAALSALGLWGAQRLTAWGRPEGWVVAALLLAAVWLVVLVVRRGLDPGLRGIALGVEARHRELEGRLLTAVQQEVGPGGELGYLQDRLVQEVLVQATHSRWLASVSWRRVWFAHGVHLLALAGFLSVVWGLYATFPRRPWVTQWVPVGLEVTPGDTELERGQSLVVMAHFGRSVPSQVELVMQPATGVERRLPLVRSLEDRTFGLTLPDIQGDLTYRLEYDEERTRDYAVRVFEFPRLEKADAELVYPAYTGLAARRVEDVRRLTAVAGTEMDLHLQLNKAVVSARLLGTNAAAIALEPGGPQPEAFLNDYRLMESRTWRLELVDAEGRTNRDPVQFVFHAVENRTPEMRLTRPPGDLRPSPLEEIALEGTVWDDYGVLAYGLAWSKVGAEPEWIELGKDGAAQQKIPFQHLLRLEDAGVEPDDLVIWHAWADDLGPDGQTRRTTSDLFFGEVRPFEEIFREGQSGGGSEAQQQQQAGGQPGSPSGQLSELQKEIINATWNLRREHREVTPQYEEKAKIVRDSQIEALAQADEAMQEAGEPRVAALWQAVASAMNTAAERLEETPVSIAALDPALAAEQTAYQALLRLQQREFEVTRGQNSQRGQGSGGQQARQRQLDQMELAQEENRYETERQATAAADENRGEQLQVLNRLKELARRQQDLNERMQELQTALQQARDEEEREEIRRQLKRLQEDQRRMVADLDEVQQRMDRPENQSRMAEQRQQLEQTREDMRRAAESAEQGAVSQALASGTRAQRQIEEVRDTLRRESASAFAEDLRGMRSEARELVQRGEEIGEDLDALLSRERKVLSNAEEKQALLEELQAQQGQLSQLVEEATRVSAEAEVAEPLASRELYDALREFELGDQSNLKALQQELLERGLLTRGLYDIIQETLNDGGAKSVRLTSEMLNRGYLPQADEAEERAREGVGVLARGVERAAERVLGDDTEALRRARSQMDEATEALAREMERAQGGDPAGSPGAEPTEGPPTGGERLPERYGRPTGDQQAGSQPGEGQPPGGQNPADSQSAAEAQSQPGAGEQAQAGGTPAPGGSPPGGGGGGEGLDLDRLLGGAEEAGGLRRGGQGGPILGEDFGPWSDQLREIEELVELPNARNTVARARERAREFRQQYRREQKKPDWAVVQLEVLGPLVEVREQIGQELARRESQDALVPIDRDPVPGRYSELVRAYYEDLGRSR